MKRTAEKNKPTVKFAVLAVLCIAAACVLGAGIWFFINAAPAESAEGLIQKNVVILKGITIAGTDVGGLTYSEAELKLAETANADPGVISITVSDGSASFTLDSADIGAKVDSEAVLAAALCYGHSGTAFENAAAKSRLGTEPFSIPLSFSFSREGVESGLRRIAQDFYIAPVLPCASVRLNEMQLQEFAYTDGSDGAELDVTATAEKILERLQNGEYSFTAELVMKPAAPAWTLDFIKKNTKRISTYSTRYRTSATDEITMNRVYNIQKAADIINACVVMPGEEWSFNGYVGMRTLEAGWKEAPGISGGKEYTLQAGGGICQVSSTLYNTLLCGNITVTDRQAHSIPSTYVPMGQDATVDSGGIDLKFRNDTAAPMYILAYTKPDPEDADYMVLTVSLYGEPLPEGVTYKPYSQMLETIENPEAVTVEDPTIPAGWQVSVSRREGYVVETTLEKFLNGHFVSTDYIHTDNYYGNPAEVRVGTGDSSLPVPEGATRVR